MDQIIAWIEHPKESSLNLESVKDLTLSLTCNEINTVFYKDGEKYTIFTYTISNAIFNPHHLEYVRWLMTNIQGLDINIPYEHTPLVCISIELGICPLTKAKEYSTIFDMLIRDERFDLIKNLQHQLSFFIRSELMQILGTFMPRDTKKVKEGIQKILDDTFYNSNITVECRQIVQEYATDPFKCRRKNRIYLKVPDDHPEMSANIFGLLTLINDNILRVK